MVIFVTVLDETLQQIVLAYAIGIPHDICPLPKTSVTCVKNEAPTWINAVNRVPSRMRLVVAVQYHVWVYGRPESTEFMVGIVLERCLVVHRLWVVFCTKNVLPNRRVLAIVDQHVERS